MMFKVAVGCIRLNAFVVTAEPEPVLLVPLMLVILLVMVVAVLTETAVEVN